MRVPHKQYNVIKRSRKSLESGGADIVLADPAVLLIKLGLVWKS